MSLHKRLFPIYLLSLVNILGFTILIPVYPAIIEEFGGNAVTYGFLISLYSFAQLIATPLMGTLSDKYGRRPMLILSQAGTLISWLIFMFALVVPRIEMWMVPLPIWIMLVSRIFDGLTGGNVSIANAYMSDVTSENEKLKAFGIIGTISSLGLIIGPLIGGIIASTNLGNTGPVWLAICLSLVTLFSIYWGLKESLPKKLRRAKLNISWNEELNIVYKVLSWRKIKKLGYLIDQRILMALVMSAYVSILILYIRRTFNWSPWQLGIVFLLIGLYFGLCQSWILHLLNKKIGEIKTLQFSYISLFLGLIGMNWVNSIYTFILPLLLTITGIAISLPLIKTLLTINVSARQQGEITGIDEAINAGSSAIMPLIGGLIFSYSVNLFWVFCGLLSIFAWMWSITKKSDYSI